MTRILELRIGTGDRSRLKLQIRGLERPDAMDSDDRNWLQAGVEVRSGRMAGAAQCSLRTEDIADFRQGLARMTDDASARAELTTMEDKLAIRLERSGGRLSAAGYIGEEGGNRLSFRFAADSPPITQILQDLDEILAEFPH